MEMGGLSLEAVDQIVLEAERRAAMAEVAAADERRKQREHDRVEKATAEADAVEAAMVQAAAAAEDAAVGETGESVAEEGAVSPSGGSPAPTPGA